jgi:hypothetical protein
MLYVERRIMPSGMVEVLVAHGFLGRFARHNYSPPGDHNPRDNHEERYQPLA